MEERISIRAEKAQRSPIPRGSYFRSVCTIFSLTNTDVDIRHIRTSADDRRLNSSMVQRELRRGIWNAKTFVYLFLKLMKLFDVTLSKPRSYILNSIFHSLFQISQNQAVKRLLTFFSSGSFFLGQNRFWLSNLRFSCQSPFTRVSMIQ